MLKKYVPKAEACQKPTRKILEPYLKLQVQMGDTRTTSAVNLMHLLRKQASYRTIFVIYFFEKVFGCLAY